MDPFTEIKDCDLFEFNNNHFEHDGNFKRYNIYGRYKKS